MFIDSLGRDQALPLSASSRGGTPVYGLARDITSWKHSGNIEISGKIVLNVYTNQAAEGVVHYPAATSTFTFKTTYKIPNVLLKPLWPFGVLRFVQSVSGGDTDDAPLYVAEIIPPLDDDLGDDFKDLSKAYKAEAYRFGQSEDGLTINQIIPGQPIDQGWKIRGPLRLERGVRLLTYPDTDPKPAFAWTKSAVNSVSSLTSRTPNERRDGDASYAVAMPAWTFDPSDAVAFSILAPHPCRAVANGPLPIESEILTLSDGNPAALSQFFTSLCGFGPTGTNWAAYKLKAGGFANYEIPDQAVLWFNPASATLTAKWASS